ncbi:NAD(P)/FAD-dependent oxidoreductase [Prosthecodimorpha staleyi]|uniref:FAD-binding oxidoreductase n=1 Tax=Prosthecodimorpha staleyi TaxID=2840188 RepID=A0A947GIJ2_9HYPH|nr:FAD-binding oxidoreductase [Prosthecodimorpha staleyi]MBT9289669.1 FAD-binding oxidoreductase [Prosthecodimorpha staleyi]
MSLPPPLPPSLWASVTPPRVPAAPLTGEVRADVAIVGAGFTGLSAALALAERGRKVVVLEAAVVGWGASGRNNGQVIPTMTGAEPDAMARLFGETGERFAQLVSDSAAGLFDLVRRKGIDCEAVQNGWFQPAHSPGRVRLSAARVEAWGRRGAPVRLLDADETARLVGSRAWHGGMLNSSGGHINPLAFARGLAAAAEAAGVVIHEASPVDSLERTPAGWVVSTGAGRVVADQVLVASNGYTDAFRPALAPALARSLVPVLSWQMATEPQAEAVRASVLPGRQALSDTHGDLRFFRWDARGRLVTGGALIVPLNGADRLRRLVGDRFARMFPQMGVPRFEFVWNGRIGMTDDRMPRFHNPAEGLWTWVACNGRGVALSTALGRVFADALGGVPQAELPVPITPVRPYPFHAVARIVAPAMLAWYRLKDAREPA